jgi:hypothetical protein
MNGELSARTTIRLTPGQFIAVLLMVAGLLTAWLDLRHQVSDTRAEVSDLHSTVIMLDSRMRTIERAVR